MWYFQKNAITIFWKWYDIRYHDISSNDMFSTEFLTWRVKMKLKWSSRYSFHLAISGKRPSLFIATSSALFWFWFWYISRACKNKELNIYLQTLKVIYRECIFDIVHMLMYRVVFFNCSHPKFSKYKKKTKYPNCSHSNNVEQLQYFDFDHT